MGSGQLVVFEDDPIAYWRLGELAGDQAMSEVGTELTSTYMNAPTLGEERLVVGDSSSCILFDASRDNYLAIPDHPDINIDSGPWKFKTVELWFKARNLPTNEPLGTGSAADVSQTQVIYEQGGITRGITVYLRGTQPGPNPTEAELWINTLNRAEEAWGGCLPVQPDDGAGNFLDPNGNPVAVSTTVSAGETYHLVFVIEGDDSSPTSFNGTIKGYLNGELFGQASGVHLLYNHTDDVALGARANEAPFHDYIS